MATRGLTEDPHYKVRYPNGSPLRVEIIEPIGPNGEPGLAVEYWQKSDGSERRELKYVLRPAVMVAALYPDGHAIAANRPLSGVDGMQCVSGTFKEDDTDPRVVAERALLAKVGCKGTLQPIGADFENTARGTRVWYYFIATDCEVVGEPTDKKSTRADFLDLKAIQKAILDRYFSDPTQPQRGHNSLMVATLAMAWLAENKPAE